MPLAYGIGPLIGFGFTVIGLIFGVFVTLHHRFMKVGELEKFNEIS